MPAQRPPQPGPQPSFPTHGYASPRPPPRRAHRLLPVAPHPHLAGPPSPLAGAPLRPTLTTTTHNRQPCPIPRRPPAGFGRPLPNPAHRQTAAGALAAAVDHHLLANPQPAGTLPSQCLAAPAFSSPCRCSGRAANPQPNHRRPTRWPPPCRPQLRIFQLRLFGFLAPLEDAQG
uniref:Uncharacterized protein n=1 Tax=Setaria viridis TaxID=4556 RepID=A0A4U6T1T1_SETVI|nr:hypothetical protein SEVIR_9G369350v2 [Setaria viridis]